MQRVEYVWRKMQLHLVLHNAFGNTVRFFWSTTVKFSTVVLGCKLGWLLSNREAFLTCANFLTFKRAKINQQHWRGCCHGIQSWDLQGLLQGLQSSKLVWNKIWEMGAHRENIFKAKSNTVINDGIKETYYCSKEIWRAKNSSRHCGVRRKTETRPPGLVSKAPNWLSKWMLLILKTISEIIVSVPSDRLLLLQALFVFIWKWHKGTVMFLKARSLRDAQLCSTGRHLQSVWFQETRDKIFKTVSDSWPNPTPKFPLLMEEDLCKCWARSWKVPQSVFGSIWKGLGCLWQLQLKKSQQTPLPK